MPNYKNSKIYKLVSNQTNDIYIGSTTQKLSNRLGLHYDKLRSHLDGKYHYVSSFELVKYDDCKIELLDKFPCESKKQLLEREGYWMRQENNCVNRCLAGRTSKQYKEENREYYKKYMKEYNESNRERIAQQRKEYREANREKIKEQKKKWREENKEKLSEKRKEKVKCECGFVGTKHHLARHQRTQIHKDNLEKLKQLEEN